MAKPLGVREARQRAREFAASALRIAVDSGDEGLFWDANCDELPERDKETIREACEWLACRINPANGDARDE